MIIQQQLIESSSIAAGLGSALLCTVLGFAFVIGLVKPALALPFAKEKTRRRVCKVYGVSILAFICMGALSVVAYKSRPAISMAFANDGDFLDADMRKLKALAKAGDYSAQMKFADGVEEVDHRYREDDLAPKAIAEKWRLAAAHQWLYGKAKPGSSGDAAKLVKALELDILKRGGTEEAAKFKTIELVNKAAINGDFHAMLRVGDALLGGDGLSFDLQNAARYYRKALEHGYEDESGAVNARFGKGDLAVWRRIPGLFGEGNGFSVYVNTESLVRRGGQVTFWAAVDTTAVETVKQEDGSARKVKYAERYYYSTRCALRQIELNAVMDVLIDDQPLASGNMKRGSYRSVTHDLTENIKNEKSLAHHLFDFVCNKYPAMTDDLRLVELIPNKEEALRAVPAGYSAIVNAKVPDPAAPGSRLTATIRITSPHPMKEYGNKDSVSAAFIFECDRQQPKYYTFIMLADDGWHQKKAAVGVPGSNEGRRLIAKSGSLEEGLFIGVCRGSGYPAKRVIQ